ncbi:MAG TPA: hypothetical protein VMU48_15240 [Terracidiphilus sp.]|nr:hypothetical protein [Terracidiphilus sp.]
MPQNSPYSSVNAVSFSEEPKGQDAGSANIAAQARRITRGGAEDAGKKKEAVVLPGHGKVL